MEIKTRANPGLVTTMLAVCMLVLVPAKGVTRDSAAKKTQKKGKVVYVCACLKTKSCSCMTEAKMEGPCACGTQGGPPMKAVPSDSAWAKHNRDALAKK